MPNNSSARRDKEKNRKDKKKSKDPKLLHKEDETSMDGSSLSLSLPGANKGRADSSVSKKDKDASLSSSQPGTVKATELLSSRAEPKSNTSVEWENTQSLSVEEKRIAYKEARIANPDASSKDLALAYRFALLKAGVKKGGTNLGEVDLSLFSGTDRC